MNKQAIEVERQQVADALAAEEQELASLRQRVETLTIQTYVKKGAILFADRMLSLIPPEEVPAPVVSADLPVQTQ